MSPAGIYVNPEIKIKIKRKNAYPLPGDIDTEQKMNVTTGSENEPGFEEDILPCCSSKE